MDELDNELEMERLHFAVQDGDRTEVERLIGAGEPIGRFDALGKTPLHYAVEAERLDIAALLLEAGADVDARDEASIGDTPLASVAASCSFEVARFLVDHGADPTIRGWMQLNAIDRSARRTRHDGPRVHELLVSAGRGGRNP